MKLPPFELERYFARYEFSAPWLLSCSDCETMSVAELLALESGSREALLNQSLGYTESRGHPMLRERIAGLYDGVSPDEVLVHTGAEEAIFNAMNVLLDPGDHVIVHFPCYQSLAAVARAIGCRVDFWRADPERHWFLDLADLKRLLRPETRLVVVNFPHNPTGHLMSRDDFRELVRLSQSHGFRIFSDEVYRFLEYDPADRLPALCELDDRGISLGVMSKAFGLAGLRIGWTVTRSRRIGDRLAAQKDYTTICNSAPSEFLSTIALQHSRTLLDRTLGIIRKNLSILNPFFERRRDRFEWRPPKAGPIAFPKLKIGDVEEFCDDLVKKAGVMLLPGTCYEAGLPFFRVGFGRRNLPECLAQLDACLDNR